MMDQLPRVIRPLKLAEADARLQGWLPLNEMSRLTARLASSEGRAEGYLQFGVDADQTHFIRGRIKASLSLICQRCLGQMQFPVDIEVSLGIIGADEDAGRLAGIYEPLLLATATGDLTEIIEDELLLALPILELHPPGDCVRGAQDELIVHAQQPPSPEDTRQPFANLAALIKTKSN